VPASGTVYNSLTGATPPPAPALMAVSPASRAFGAVTIGQTGSRAFTVANTGAETLTGTASAGGPFGVSGGSPFSVAGGASVTVTVGFAPTAAVNYSNRVVFTSNGGSATGVVTGAGVTPAALLQVLPTDLDFGGVVTGTMAEAVLTVSNAGSGFMTGTVSVAAGPFAVMTNLYSLTGLAWTSVVVRFSPITAGALTNEVVFDGNGGSLSIPVTGSGVAVVVPSVLRFKAASYSAVEGAKVKVTVLREGGTQGAVSVKCLTKNGTALAFQDYAMKSVVLTWADGDGAPKIIKLPILADAVAEGNESFNIKLPPPRGRPHPPRFRRSFW
jgi:hypothetical protein